jgi:hypothetical protein
MLSKRLKRKITRICVGPKYLCTGQGVTLAGRILLILPLSGIGSRTLLQIAHAKAHGLGQRQGFFLRSKCPYQTLDIKGGVHLQNSAMVASNRQCKEQTAHDLETVVINNPNATHPPQIVTALVVSQSKLVLQEAEIENGDRSQCEIEDTATLLTAYKAEIGIHWT